MLFDLAYKFTKENEGGFSDNPHDKGGKTIYGISSVYFPNDYERIITSPKSDHTKLCKEFYLREFWNPLYEQLIDKKLAIRLFDLGVNVGKLKSVILLQRGICVKADGIFGGVTLRTTNEDEWAYEKLIAEAEKHYKTRQDFNVFGKGWLNRLYKPIMMKR